VNQYSYLSFPFDKIKLVITSMKIKASFKTHLNTEHQRFNVETHMGENHKETYFNVIKAPTNDYNICKHPLVGDTNPLFKVLQAPTCIETPIPFSKFCKHPLSRHQPVT
jgi:hypothetical protein